MRISTSQIYDSGVLGIQRGQTALYKLQNQISSGRRVLTPQDDPVAAAQALVVTQSQGVNAQHADNQTKATSQLGLVDSQMTSLVTLLQSARDLIIQGGNTGTMSNSDRQSLANDMASRLSEMVGIANAKDGSGDYLFSGYQGATLPFAISAASPAVPPSTVAPYAYSGDDGERLLQVSSSRQLAVNVPGSDLFMDVRNGNGTFVARTGGNIAGGINQGSATIDAGSVLNPTLWTQAVNNAAAGQPLEIRFTVAGSVTTYGIYDPVSGLTSGPLPYTSGQAIPLVTSAGVDFGSQVVVQGQPANNDRFTITPSSSQSIFQTLQNTISILQTPVTQSGYTATQLSNDLAQQLTNLDQGLSNVSRVQSLIGTRMREIDALANTSSDLDIQYESVLLGLQALDYAKAISDFTQQNTNLQAAQKSFVQIAGLSLFNYI